MVHIRGITTDYKVKATIVEKVLVPIILGNDWLERNEVELNMSKKVGKVKGEPFMFSIQPDEDGIDTLLACVKKVVIKPGHVMLIEVRGTYYKLEENYIIQDDPIMCYWHRLFDIQKCYQITYDGAILIPVVNAND